GVRDRLQRKVTLEHGGADGIFVIDETSDAKKGAHTAGVARQYCGESGKIDNCIVTVHLAYVRGEFHALLDGALFLPEAWDWNPKDPPVMKRRAAAGIPETVRHETKAAMALRQLRRALSNGVPGRYVTADEWYGSKPWWRREVDAMGLTQCSWKLKSCHTPMISHPSPVPRG
ncbi:MAG: transposase, partial [Planctomycetota bacterium]